MKAIPGQIACFRVFPEPGKSRLYFDVRVFTSLATLRRYLKRSRLPERTLGRYGLAMCSTFGVLRARHGKTTRTLPILGELLFPVRALRAGIIAHECTHAALGWASRIGLNPVSDRVRRRGHLWASDTEERFCYGLGELNRQIAVQVWDRKLDRP